MSTANAARTRASLRCARRLASSRRVPASSTRPRPFEHHQRCAEATRLLAQQAPAGAIDKYRTSTAAARDPVAAIASSNGIKREVQRRHDTSPSKLQVSAGRSLIMFDDAYLEIGGDRLWLPFVFLPAPFIICMRMLIGPYSGRRYGDDVEQPGRRDDPGLRLVAGADPTLLGIVLLSLRVSLMAVAIACVIGLPFGALVAVSRFPGRRGVSSF